LNFEEVPPFTDPTSLTSEVSTFEFLPYFIILEGFVLLVAVLLAGVVGLELT